MAALTMSVHATSTGDSMETGMSLTNGPISGCFFSVLFMVEAHKGASATLKSMLPPTLCINFCGVSAKKYATKSWNSSLLRPLPSRSNFLYHSRHASLEGGSSQPGMWWLTMLYTISTPSCNSLSSRYPFLLLSTLASPVPKNYVSSIAPTASFHPSRQFCTVSCTRSSPRTSITSYVFALTLSNTWSVNFLIHCMLLEDQQESLPLFATRHTPR
mmetsp:Transcript_9481/g.57829  ORF Transcript_9481/g.57829 Transcript_9481/m.57829 type:complete len:215 (-) Transcript_9481:68-712(-)